MLFRSGIHVCLLEGVAVILLAGLEVILRIRRKRAELLKVVMLYCGGEKLQVQAWYDTGNSLYDPFNGKPVSILEKSCMEQLLSHAERERISRKIHVITVESSSTPKKYIKSVSAAEYTVMMQAPTLPSMAAIAILRNFTGSWQHHDVSKSRITFIHRFSRNRRSTSTS